MKITPDKKSERFVDETTIRNAIRSRQSYLQKEHGQEKKNRIHFKYVEVDLFGKEMSEIFHYSSTPFVEHAEAFISKYGKIDFGAICKEERRDIVVSLCENYKNEKVPAEKMIILKALSHLLEGTFLKDRKESATKTYILENMKHMYENDMFKEVSESLYTNVKELEQIYEAGLVNSNSRLTGISMNNLAIYNNKGKFPGEIHKQNSPNVNTNEDNNRKDLNVIKDNLITYSSILCMMLVGVIGGRFIGIRDSLRAQFMETFDDGRIFIQFLLDCLALFCNRSASEIPIKKFTILTRLSLLIMLGTSVDADNNHDKQRQCVNLNSRQHRLNFPKKSKISTPSTISQPYKIRFDDFIGYMSEVYMNHFGMDITPLIKENKFVVFSLYTKFLPPILHHSIEDDKKHVYIPLSEINIKQENNYQKYPLTTKILTYDFLEPIELLYKTLCPSIGKYVVAILKLFLSSIPHKTSASELPIYSELGFRNSTNSSNSINANKDDPNLSVSNVLYSLKKSVDRTRHQEILSKSISSILFLLLKHSKSNNYYQFETICYHMAASNFIQLACKFMGLGFDELSINKTSLDDYDFPWTLWEQSLVDTEKEISKVKLTKQGSFTYKTTFERKNNWRILHTLTNILRILQKVTKYKPNRIRLLTYYKTSISLRKIIKLKCTVISYFALKILKSQIPYLGKVWCKGNWKVFSLIYFLTHMHIHEDWVNSSEKTLMNNELKDLANLGVKNIHERKLKETLDSYNQKYLTPSINDRSTLLANIPGSEISNSLDDSEFDDYLQNAFPIVAMKWVDDNVINNQNDWDEFQNIMGFNNYL